MKIIHRFSLNTKVDQLLLQQIEKLGVVPEGESGISIIRLLESDPNLPIVKEILKGQYEHITAVFDDSDRSSAPYLAMCAACNGCYPHPSQNTFGYEVITYDLSKYCSKCHCGKFQNNPFRVKGKLKWGRNGITTLNWVFDVLFVTDAAFKLVFEPFGISSMPVMQPSGEIMDGVVQLVPQDVVVPALDLGGFDHKVCAQCGGKKYVPGLKGYFPSFAEDAKGHYIQTNEWFGSGGDARRKILISQKLYRKIKEADIKGGVFDPQKEATPAPGKESAIHT